MYYACTRSVRQMLLMVEFRVGVGFHILYREGFA